MRCSNLLLLTLIPGVACRADGPAEPLPVDSPEPVAAEPATASEDHVALGPDFHVRWRAEPGPIPLNEPFGLLVHLGRGEDGREPLEDARLRVDAWMPAHFHGMLRMPEVEELGGGAYRVRGMLFHMRGHWQLRFDLADDEGVRTRATSDVELR